MKSIRSNLKKLSVGIAMVSLASLASAAFPEKPIRVIVPFPPGGAADNIARLVTQKMSKSLGQSIYVDFKPGAATIIGADLVRSAAPDGYTLLLGSATTFVVNPIIYSKLNYNARTSFTPIGIIGSTKLALLANAEVPAKNLDDAVSFAKSNPSKSDYASHGNGSTVHFVAEMLWKAADTKVVHVPYKGSAPAMLDLMAGRVPFSFDSVPAAVSAASGGKVRILATSGTVRSPLLPDVPTMAESYPGVSLESWWAFVAPSGIPADVQSVLEAALAEAVSDKEVQAKLTAIGFDTGYGTPAEYFEFIKRDTVRLAPIAKENNIQQD